MMSCTVHSPTDSLAQPTCILVYIECNPAEAEAVGGRPLPAEVAGLLGMVRQGEWLQGATRKQEGV